MIALVAPITAGLGHSFAAGHRPLTHASNFLRGKESAYWHRPRSGVVYEDGRIVYSYWCGQHAFGSRVIERSDPPNDEPVCGSCEGRAIGAGHIAGNSEYDTKFAPRYQTPPKHCPGGGPHSDLWEQVAPRVGKCLVCGTFEPIRYSGGPYRSDVGLAKHEPASDIMAVRCDFHGWSQLAVRNGSAVCRCMPESDTQPASLGAASTTLNPPPGEHTGDQQ